MPREAPGQGQDFVAPDESRRINEPNKAEHMARVSDKFRSAAAKLREKSQDLKLMGAVGSNHESIEAGFKDFTAEQVENFESLSYDMAKEVASIPVAEYPERLKILDEQLTELRGRIEPMLQATSGDAQAKYNTIRELNEKRTRLELMKLHIQEQM
jgi:predicted Ser/Thr protein kinase